MYPDILRKVLVLLNSPTLSESDVLYLMAQSRKLMEQIPSERRAAFSSLGLYCDWSLHTSIDRARGATEMLARLHNLLVQQIASGDNREFTNEVTRALAFSQVRVQLNALLASSIGAPALVAVDQTRWVGIAVTLAEILSDIPIAFPPSPRPREARVIAQLRRSPIQDDRIVERLEIKKIPTHELTGSTADSSLTYCAVITLSGPVTIVSPLARPQLSE